MNNNASTPVILLFSLFYLALADLKKSLKIFNNKEVRE